MKYLEKSFSVPPAELKAGKNRHGQTWEDIFGPPSPAFCPHKNTSGGNDYIYCADCNTEWDYRKQTPPLVPVKRGA